LVAYYSCRALDVVFRTSILPAMAAPNPLFQLSTENNPAWLMGFARTSKAKGVRVPSASSLPMPCEMA
ncbi:MAG: hypothetical protein Q7U25_06495, partial [Sulfuricella sp.]|nr:hypothetical protein [Sulfuricella sp.]